jgi:hypothetical protein
LPPSITEGRKLRSDLRRRASGPMSSEQRIKCRRAFGISIPKFAVDERWVTGLTTATRCLRSTRRPVEGLAQRPFPQGNFIKTLMPSGYPISFTIETKQTIRRRLIHTLHSVGRIIPRFAIAIRAAAGDRNAAHPGGASGHARTAPDFYVLRNFLRTSKSC